MVELLPDPHAQECASMAPLVGLMKGGFLEGRTTVAGTLTLPYASLGTFQVRYVVTRVRAQQGALENTVYGE